MTQPKRRFQNGHNLSPLIDSWLTEMREGERVKEGRRDGGREKERKKCRGMNNGSGVVCVYSQCSQNYSHFAAFNQ